MRKSHLLAGSVVAAACFPIIASAQTILFQENFDAAGAETRFTQHKSANAGAIDSTVDFFYNYGEFEYLRFPTGSGNPPTIQPIPPAPGGTSTRGLRISVNDSIGAANTLQLIPNGVQPGTDFRMEFHMWMNYNGGALGGTGSTQAMVAGLNTNPGGTGIIGPSPTAFDPQAVNGYAFTANGEGGAAADYRMYDRGEPPGFDDGPAFPKVNGTWAAADELRFNRTTGELVLTGAGSTLLDRPSNHTNSYYDLVFPGDDIGGGSFETRGAPGKAWVPVAIEQRGNEVTFSMNGHIISTLFRADAAIGVPEFGYTDEFNSVADPAIDNFILYDNLLITQLSAAPRFTATSGNYSNAANWSGGTPPNGANEKADFGGASGPSTVTVDAPVTLRSIVFSGPNSYTVNGPSTITMSAGANTLMSNAGSHTLNAPVNSQGHLSAYVAQDSTLRVTNLTHDASKGFMKAGVGTFEVNRVRSNHITVTGGTLKLLPGGTSRTNRIDVLNSTSKVDMTTAGLIVDWTYRQAPGDPTINTNPREAIIAEILAGFNAGTWDGFGIYSGNAQANPANYAVGYADTSLINITSFGGEAVDNTSMLVRGTRRGDANVDGLVNLQDFNLLAANFGATDAFWWQGDFNYDETVNLQDFNALAANFGQSAAGSVVTPQDWANLAAAIPEPTSLALLGAGALSLLRRRRRD